MGFLTKQTIAEILLGTAIANVIMAMVFSLVSYEVATKWLVLAALWFVGFWATRNRKPKSSLHYSHGSVSISAHDAYVGSKDMRDHINEVWRKYS